MHHLLIGKNAKASLFLAIFLAVPFFFPLSADAAVIRASRDVVSVPEEAVVPGDFYAFGSTVKVAGTVEGDVYVIGGTVVITGPVGGDVVVLGGRVSIRGAVADDVRFAGGEVIIEGSVGGDIFGTAGSLAIERSASTAGDLYYYGGTSRVEGLVAGTLYVRAGELAVDGEVGAIDALVVESLSLEGRTNVKGDILYRSGSELSRAQDAKVGGRISRQEVKQDSSEGVKDLLVLTLMFLFASLVSVLLFRERLESLFGDFGDSFGVSGFAGLGFFLGAPLAAFLLFVSLLGVFAGMFLLALYVTVLFAGGILTGIFIGATIMRFVRTTYQVTWFSALLGVLTIPVLIMIPFVGLILLFALYLATIGMLVRSVYRTLRA
jgi:cytoskeletal protein CcmA (bactofilin family)